MFLLQKYTPRSNRRSKKKIEIAANPYAFVANGIPTPLTFIPYNPEIIVGNSKIIVIAAKNPNPEEIKYEISDFLYHAMVLMVERGVTWEDIVKELADR